MLDAYGISKIHYTDQNLAMDDDISRISEMSKDEQIRRFKSFIKEYQSESRYVYRYDILVNNLEIN